VARITDRTGKMKISSMILLLLVAAGCTTRMHSAACTSDATWSRMRSTASWLCGQIADETIRQQLVQKIGTMKLPRRPAGSGCRAPARAPFRSRSPTRVGEPPLRAEGHPRVHHEAADLLTVGLFGILVLASTALAGLILVPLGLPGLWVMVLA